ncbi:rhomboid family intramembrane serine protease [Streptacidiphilus sp. P02-A3a]|uniref:rhomboid family intramembrane serine protease n=1 Tax=Streptacidiphilus sp. P02-A3a TaxID=2704468 RepID=UPI0015FC3166|nr:rhomboid family intramembrane serine protease [Streptacidiphilus sp. P02-A3a]QMU67630.1 rhomboid family intramembrane serine protease [Streptacidiphilus sp. P02-A3a]
MTVDSAFRQLPDSTMGFTGKASPIQGDPKMIDTRELELYASAAVVFGAGKPLLTALSATRPGDRSPARILAAIWSRGPWVTGLVMVTMLVMIGLRYAVPGLGDRLMRHPGALDDGQWWRVFTALFIQSSGLVQIVVNVAALAVAGPIAERVFGAGRWLLVFFGSGVVANVVSEEGWSRHGGGSSIAICGLVGALAMTYLLRSGEFAADGDSGTGPGTDLAQDPTRLRRLTLAIPAAGAFLCAIHNNHGAGLLTGCVLGLVLTATAGRRALGLPRDPVRAGS